MKMTIMQGIPGSGKSTWAKQNRPNAICVSADTYFMTPNGQYAFDPSKLGQAHGACFHAAIIAASKRQDIVVDNTNTTAIEIAPYVALAQAYEMEVEFVKCMCDLEVAHARCKHGVPFAGVLAASERLDDFSKPPFWNGATKCVHTQ